MLESKTESFRLVAVERHGSPRVLRAMTESPEYYRMKASETLALARQVKNTDQKAYLLKVAERYEELAAEAEKAR